jgi:hypothetical protein
LSIGKSLRRRKPGAGFKDHHKKLGKRIHA